MTPAELNDRARMTVLTAAANGIAVTNELLATAYGMSIRWAGARRAEARADRTEDAA